MAGLRHARRRDPPRRRPDHPDCAPRHVRRRAHGCAPARGARLPRRDPGVKILCEQRMSAVSFCLAPLAAPWSRGARVPRRDPGVKILCEHTRVLKFTDRAGWEGVVI